MSNGNEQHCPICELEGARIQTFAVRDVPEVECTRCGNFAIEGILLRLMARRDFDEREDTALLPYLSAHTRQATAQGILTKLSRENWRDLARSHKTTSVSQKVTKFLELVAARSRFPGALAPVEDLFDYPLLNQDA